MGDPPYAFYSTPFYTIKRYNKAMAGQMTKRIHRWTPWLLSVATSLVAIIGWGSSLGWQLDHLSIYQVFPVFGLLAFSIMWSQYVVIYLQRYFLSTVPTKRYFAITGYMVLALILVHPSLLAAQRFVEGFGLPPGSYLSYVGPARSIAVVTGMLSLLLFLTFELRRYLRTHGWWRFVEYGIDGAMIGIVYHSLTLGTQLSQVPWLRGVWYLYAITLVYILGARYLAKLR